jgi:hypothetical protein
MSNFFAFSTFHPDTIYLARLLRLLLPQPHPRPLLRRSRRRK